jgi:hypothetical protein
MYVRFVYDRCGALFRDYPLAVRDVSWIRSVQSVVLCVPDDDDGSFAVLVRDTSEGEPRYSLVPWQTGGPVVTISAASDSVPHLAAAVLARGTPVPRHGSLFGWLTGSAVTALIAVYADHAPEYPEPSWAVMPLAGTPHDRWPPFTSERLFGPWFWEHYRARRIVSLAGPIAGRPGTVFWVQTETALGWDCCVVSEDITDDDAYVVLPRGCYLYYEGLRPDDRMPAITTLLATSAKTDLAPRMRPLTRAAS